MKSEGKGLLGRFHRMCKGPEEAYGFRGTKKTLKPERKDWRSHAGPHNTVVPKEFGFYF